MIREFSTPPREDRGEEARDDGPSPCGSDVDLAVDAAQRHLLGLQADDGHWCAELEGDNILESEYAMLLWFLGKRDDPRLSKLCNYLRSCQNEEGGWSIYPGGPSDPNPSVKAYFALKLIGDSPDAPHMVRARQAIRDAGGVEACNSFTKLWLAVFGQYSWRQAPAVPPEIIRAPNWLPINIWEMSSWSRAIVVPLSIVWALKPSCEVPEGRGIEELDAGEKVKSFDYMRRQQTYWQQGWAAFFRGMDKVVKLLEAVGFWRIWRHGSIERCRAWIEPRLEKSAGLAAIFPPILNVIVAYRALGYGEDHPIVRSQIEELEKLEIEEGDTLRIQPCASPVWDTSLTLGALLDTGLSHDHPAVAEGVRWLLEREVSEAGDWQVKNPQGPIGGWYFEYANEFYPDCDDTAEIIALLSNFRPSDPELARRTRAAVDRAIAWQRSMQNRDGGWAAFDRECNRQLLTLIPFADHNAMIDPSTADVSARTVEALVLAGLTAEDAAVSAGVEFLLREQEEDGSWYGRWGANYLYGTWLALQALAPIDDGPQAERVTEALGRGVAWLLEHQNPDGGWGESLRSYDDASWKGRGESTAAQTAWAMLGLMAAAPSRVDDPRVTGALARGVDHLLRTQRGDGSWLDEHWTGTGFPSVFYLRYHSYARYFPLQALSTWRRRLGLALPAESEVA
jgi:squalene-hopene/tetraprenyl-beta-curcumene cyclase